MARFQQTLASQASFEKFGRKGKRELFLDQMNQVVPWSELLGVSSRNGKNRTLRLAERP